MSRAAGTARLATWNVRWFPDGRTGKPRGGSEFGTDLSWLACALGSLDVDVAALQELKGGSRSERASNRLLELLDRRTGGQWRLLRDDCRSSGTQQVALLYDERRVSLESSRVLPSLNAHGKACAGRLRPGLAAYLKFRGGLDLHLISVHLKSGTDRRSFELRRRALAGLDRGLAELRSAHDDDDVVLAGDLNTMGCEQCAPRTLAEQELVLLDRELAALHGPLGRIESDLGCSVYDEGRPALLDHFLVSRGTAELGASTRVHAAGFCGGAACGRLRARKMPLAYRHLSDHCPLVLELEDVDRD